MLHPQRIGSWTGRIPERQKSVNSVFYRIHFGTDESWEGCDRNWNVSLSFFSSAFRDSIFACIAANSSQSRPATGILSIFSCSFEISCLRLSDSVNGAAIGAAVWVVRCTGLEAGVDAPNCERMASLS